MSKPERGSLSVVKRALPAFAPAESTKELEDRLLAGDARRPEAEGQAAAAAPVRLPDEQTAVPPAAVHPLDVLSRDPDSTEPFRPAATRLTPRPGKGKEPVQMVTYRIPASLYDRLFRVAEYNNLTMTDIVVEAVERHLPNFALPTAR